MQTKSKINNTELQGAVQKVINEEFSKWIEDNFKIMKTISQKIITNAKASLAAKKAKDLTVKKNDKSFSIISDLSKLAACNSKNPEECEIFIVEGNSAGGTAKNCRNKQYQAVYALRGKPLNTNNLDVLKILENKEYADLVYILTGKRNGIGENFDLKDLKYHKIIILADADVDGLHITSLLLSFFYKHMRPLIDAGMVYVAMPPLYSVLENKKRRYFLNDDEYNDYIFEIINKKFTFSIDGNVMNKESNIKSLLNKLERYTNKLNYYAINKGIDISLLEKVVIEKRNNPDMTNKELGKFIKSIGDFVVSKNEDGKTEFKGLHENTFTDFVLVTLIKYAKSVIEYCDKIKLPLGITITETNSEKDLGTPSLAFVKLNELAIPKSRVRLKGLGRFLLN